MANSSCEQAANRCKPKTVLLNKRPRGKLTCYAGVYTGSNDFHSTSPQFHPFLDK